MKYIYRYILHPLWVILTGSFMMSLYVVYYLVHNLIAITWNLNTKHCVEFEGIHDELPDGSKAYSVLLGSDVYGVFKDGKLSYRYVIYETFVDAMFCRRKERMVEMKVKER